MVDMEHIFDEFSKAWPSPVVAREKVGEFSGGVLSPKYMANLDSQGLGCERIKFSRKVAYPKASLVKFMRERAKMES